MDGKNPPKPGKAQAEQRQPGSNPSFATTQVPSSAEITSRIKVDPWTGEVLPELSSPRPPPAPPGSRPPPPPTDPADPDQTSEVKVDPMTGQVIETSRKIGPRVPFGQMGPGTPPLETVKAPNRHPLHLEGELFHETTLEVDTNVYQERLEGDEQSWPALAGALPPRDDGEPGAPSDRPSGGPDAVAPPSMAGYPSHPPSPRPYGVAIPDEGQHPSVVDNIESISAAQAWPHVALGRGSHEPEDGFTLGVKAVLFVAIASLAVGATLGSVVTVTLLDGEVPPPAPTPTPVLQSDHGGSTQRAESNRPTNDSTKAAGRPTPIVISDGESLGDKLPQPANASLEEGLPDEIILPITFPKLSADPTDVNRERIKQIADLMLQDRSMMVEIVGYISPDETGKIAEGLAARRARIAAGLIGGYGPSRSRFRAKSGGISSDLPKKAVLRVRLE